MNFTANKRISLLITDFYYKVMFISSRHMDMRIICVDMGYSF